MKNMFISHKRKVTVIKLQMNDKIQADFLQPCVGGLHYIMTDPF